MFKKAFNVPMSISLPQVFTGGYRTTYNYATWPFAKFVVDKTHLALVMPFKKEFHFSVQDVTEISVSKHFLLRLPIGIQIKHNQKDTPEKVIFWFFKVQKLLNCLQHSEFGKKICKNN